jgi:hypothetical protein
MYKSIGQEYLSQICLEKCLIQSITHELDWQLVIENLCHRIERDNQEYSHPLLVNLFQLLSAFISIDHYHCHTDHETISIHQIFSLLHRLLTSQSLVLSMVSQGYSPTLVSNDELHLFTHIVHRIIQYLTSLSLII